MKKPTLTKSTLGNLALLEQLRQTFQRHRIQMSNRIAAVEAERSQMDPATMLHFCERFRELEDEVTHLIARTIVDHELWPWLEAIKGIGPGLAGALLAPMDIERAPSVSSLWAFCGLSVEDGHAVRPIKGQKLPYHAGLKKTCFLIAASFLRSGSSYRAEYDEAKEEYQRTRPDWTDGHRDLAARRKMVKLFISHLWTVWRCERNLPVRAPYALQVLHHDGVKPPWRYAPYAYDARVMAVYANGVER